MKNIFFISDTHFGDTDMTVITNPNNGKPLRPWRTVEEHDEALIENWNKVVKPNDKVYHLGDVAMPRKSLHILDRLNGKKVLIRGNHDIYSLKDYSKYFYDIRGMFVMPNTGMVLTHAPIHPSCRERFGCNIHGHIHEGEIWDTFYTNICVEKIDFTPISFEDLESEVCRKGASILHVPKRRIPDWSNG
jgi:calcineurin-like phosphoesterase family protein